jgi:peptidoglycan/LPS O-acetylase OafA/YrhL
VSTKLAEATTATASAPPRFRADIEGLRSVAVLLVVGNHLLGWPAGGFVGVDVFFVISGFLITGILLRQVERTGRISFGEFYRRRVLRIVPAAMLVLLVTTAATWLVFLPVRAAAATWDAVFSALFAANWNLVAQGAQYFAATAVPSAFQHYWSLSVEEQFYVVWPWLILAVAALATRRSFRSVLVVVVVVGAVVSFAYACMESGSRPSWGYFSTFSRAWEMAVGALVALAPRGWVVALGRRGNAVVWMIGLMLIIASAVLLTSESQFPGPWALLPVAGAAAILFASRAGSWQAPLTNPVARYVGRISYSLYLWHWPVVVFLITLAPDAGLIETAFAFAVMVGLSAATYHLVEQPARKLTWGADRVRRASPGADRALGVTVAVALAAMCVLPWAPRPSAAAATVDDDATEFSTVAELSAEVRSAAHATAWPALSPAIGELTREDSALAVASGRGCIASTRGDVIAEVRQMSADCVLGSAGSAKTAVVLGDSIAASWLPALERALPDWRIVGIAFESCPANEATVDQASARRAFRAECERARDAAVERTRELAPDLVVLSSALGSYERQVPDGSLGPQQNWERGTIGMIEAVSATSRVAVLQSPPEGRSPADCATRVQGPSSCLTEASDSWLAKSEAEAEAAATAAAHGSEAVFVRTTEWFCTADGACPIFAAGTPIRVDQGHLTAEYARRLGSILAMALAASGATA